MSLTGNNLFYVANTWLNRSLGRTDDSWLYLTDTFIDIPDYLEKNGVSPKTPDDMKLYVYTPIIPTGVSVVEEVLPDGTKLYKIPNTSQFKMAYVGRYRFHRRNDGRYKYKKV